MAVIRKRKILKEDQKVDSKLNEKEEEKVKGQADEKEEDLDKNESIKSKIWGYFKLFIQLSILLAIAPALVNFAALIREEKLLKPEGDFVDVRSNQKLFKTCIGKGKPTVIFDAALGETSDLWSVIIPAISKITKVCTYDRAGLGYSDRNFMSVNQTKKSGKPHTVERMFEDFHKLFENEEKPFVLVGADLGSAVAKFYTQMFRDSVASLILINPMFSGLFLGEKNPWNKYWFYSFLPSLQMKHMCSAAGLMRIGIQTGLVKDRYIHDNVPGAVKLRQKYLLCNPSHASSVVEESYFLNETLSQMRTLNKLRSLPSDVPITLVLTNKFNDDVPTDINKIWLQSQEFVTKMYANDHTEVIKLKGSLYKVLFSQQNTIQKMIKKAIKRWKTNSKSNSKY